MNADFSTAVCRITHHAGIAWRRRLVCAVLLVMTASMNRAAVADNTNLRADSVSVNMVFRYVLPAECPEPNCPDCHGYVNIRRTSCDMNNCALKASKNFNVPGLPPGVQPETLMLYEIETSACEGGGTGEGVNLLSFPTPPMLPIDKWEQLLKYASATPGTPGSWIVLADFGEVIAPSGGRADPTTLIASGNPAKGVPTLSEWAVVLMTLLLIAAGTVLFGRRRRNVAVV